MSKNCDGCGNTTDESEDASSGIILCKKCENGESKGLSMIENTPEPKQHINNADILLVALVTAIAGFANTKPDMTVVELDKLVPKILSFARDEKPLIF